MINKSIIKDISGQEMDRKDFLKYSGLVLIGLVGLTGVLKFISQTDKPSIGDRSDRSSHGFGGGRYGA